MRAGSEPSAAVSRHPEITRVRRAASGILIGLTTIFVATHFVPEPQWYVLLIRSMAEAGMIGGLADWFAVEALFRHPLGIPIPHTALLPNNQKRAARNVARFFDEYFLAPDQITAQIRSLDLVRRMSDWLSQRPNADRIASELIWVFGQIAGSSLASGLRTSKGTELRLELLRSVDADRTARQVSGLLSEMLDTRMLDTILGHVKDLIDTNRPKITEIAQEHSRWWIASNVDRRIVALLVDGVISVIDELRDDKTDLRQDLIVGLLEVLNAPQMQRDLAGLISVALETPGDTTDAPAIDAIIAHILSDMANDVKTSPEVYASFFADVLQDVAARLQQDHELREKLSARLSDVVTTVLDQARPALRSYVEQTMSQWDSTALVTRIEAEVGRDLQFIRINGAILGSVLGGLIFAVSHGFFGV